MTGAAADALARTSTPRCGRPSAHRHRRASALVRTSPPRRCDERARRHRRRSGGAARPAARARRPTGRGPNSSASTRTNVGADASSGDWLSAATASGSHSHSRMRRAWPCRVAATRDTVTPSGGRDGVRIARERPARAASAAAIRSDRQAIAPGQRVPAEDSRQPGAAAAAAAGSAAPTASVHDRGTAPPAPAASGTFSSAPMRRRKANVS